MKTRSALAVKRDLRRLEEVYNRGGGEIFQSLFMPRAGEGRLPVDGSAP
jgi:hypothetical protein